MTYYRCIVTLKSGLHKTLRVSKDMVAKICYEFREMQRSIWKDTIILCVRSGESLTLNDIISCKFINEYTREEFLTLS